MTHLKLLKLKIKLYLTNMVLSFNCSLFFLNIWMQRHHSSSRFGTQVVIHVCPFYLVCRSLSSTDVVPSWKKRQSCVIIFSCFCISSNKHTVVSVVMGWDETHTYFCFFESIVPFFLITHSSDKIYVRPSTQTWVEMATFRTVDVFNASAEPWTHYTECLNFSPLMELQMKTGNVLFF